MIKELRKNICCSCWETCYLVDLKWRFYCESCLTGGNKIQHYIKDKMTIEQKVSFAINILYDIKYDDISDKNIEKAINNLQNYFK